MNRINRTGPVIFCFWFVLFPTPKYFISNVILRIHDSGKIISKQILLILFNQLITKTRLSKYTENFTTKKWKFSDKNSDIFYISAQNIDCGCSLEPPRRGGSNEYPQSMFLSKNKKNKVYPCKP